MSIFTSCGATNWGHSHRNTTKPLCKFRKLIQIVHSVPEDDKINLYAVRYRSFKCGWTGCTFGSGRPSCAYNLVQNCMSDMGPALRSSPLTPRPCDAHYSCGQALLPQCLGFSCQTSAWSLHSLSPLSLGVLHASCFTSSHQATQVFA